MNYVERADMLHKKGYNCAQAVFCAFADVLELDEKTAYKIAEGFGSGMGGQFETCGALTGAYMVLSMHSSDGELGSKRTRPMTYQMFKEASARFRETAQSTLCREIKGMTGGPVLRSCGGCVTDAAKIVVDMLGL